MRNKAIGWKTSALPMPPVPLEPLGGQQLALESDSGLNQLGLILSLSSIPSHCTSCR